MARIKIKSKGMHCSSCEILVIDSLEEIEGVNEAEASFKTGIISVDFDESKVNEKKLKEIVRKEGYEVE